MFKLTCYDLSDGKEPVSYQELDCLKELVSDLPANPTIVNIGAAQGLSTMAFLEERPDAFIYSVDVLPCREEFEHLSQGGHDLERVVRLLGDSKEIGPEFPHQCDLLFIDGDHWGAAGDIKAWVETGKMRPGGIVAFHDWQPNGCAPNNPGSVTEDVRAWAKEHPEFLLVAEVERVIAFRVPE